MTKCCSLVRVGIASMAVSLMIYVGTNKHKRVNTLLLTTNFTNMLSVFLFKYVTPLLIISLHKKNTNIDIANIVKR